MDSESIGDDPPAWVVFTSPSFFFFFPEASPYRGANDHSQPTSLSFLAYNHGYIQHPMFK